MNQESEDWTDYWTWMVYVWLINNPASHEYWRQKVREHVERAEVKNDERMATNLAAFLSLADDIEAELQRTNPLKDKDDVYGDLLFRALGQIDYRQIASKLLEDRLPLKVWTDCWGPPELFPTGEIVCTDAARQSLTMHEMNSALNRHVCGDWQDLDWASLGKQHDAIKHDLPLRSAFESEKGSLFLIVTNAERSRTTIQLPVEYQEK